MARCLVTRCLPTPSCRMLLFVESLLVVVGFCVNSGTDASSHQTSHLSGYEIVIPKLIHDRQKRNVDQGQWMDQVSYSINLDGEENILKLEKNKKLLGKDFVQYTYGKFGKKKSSQPKIQVHCYYHGIVEGITNSKVLLSTCVGIRGIIFILEKCYIIEPLDGSSTFEHLIYQMKDLEVEPAKVCGVPHHDGPANHTHHHLNNGSILHNLRVKRAILGRTNYVELVLVVDNDKYNLHNRNETLIQNQMVELVHFVNGFYSSLNVGVILTGLAIWKDEDQIAITSNAREVLDNFIRWRERILLPELQHDSGHLILGKEQFRGILGLAFVGTVCSFRLGAGIDVFAGSDVPRAATLLAHELGHNLGISHDDGRTCQCPDSGGCIMSGTLTRSSNFTDCSESDFINLIERRQGLCLQNKPNEEDQYTLPSCGNNIVDEEEECDCGAPEKCANPCCDARTCKLTSGSDCAHGRCCRDCKFHPAGTLCRAASDVCDLPEYCNGSSSFCQPDFFVQNGYPCANFITYCYEGVCQTYDYQCQILFGLSSRRAPDKCFEVTNMHGDRFGNCGLQNSRFKPCSRGNAACGKIQCIEVTERPFGVDTSNTFIDGVECVNADFHVGTDVTDPSYVNTGTGCANGKACKNFECANDTNLGYDCDVQEKCYNHGVCNNRKNCHCDDGWAPPNCATSGFGGSIDSGPTRIDTSLRDGLLIFFLLVVPVLFFVGMLIFFKRNAVKQLWRKRNSSQGTTKNRRQQNTSPNQANQKNNAPIPTTRTNVYANYPPQRSNAPTPSQHIPVVLPRPPVPLRPTAPPRV
ncbi:disintegrin and metalloproteinase domain-containing protein 9 [Rhinoraja longicauda]